MTSAETAAMSGQFGMAKMAAVFEMGFAQSDYFGRGNGIENLVAAALRRKAPFAHS